MILIIIIINYIFIWKISPEIFPPALEGFLIRNDFSKALSHAFLSGACFFLRLSSGGNSSPFERPFFHRYNTAWPFCSWQ